MGARRDPPLSRAGVFTGPHGPRYPVESWLSRQLTGQLGMAGGGCRALRAWHAAAARAAFLRSAGRHLHARWILARRARGWAGLCRARELARCERIVRHRAEGCCLHFSLGGWRARTVWHVVWRRVSLRIRRCTVAAWRRGTGSAIANRRVARKVCALQQAKRVAQVFREWDLRRRERAGVRRRLEHAARAAVGRSVRMLLFGVVSEWIGKARTGRAEQQIHKLTMAVESYEQALTEVGNEKAGLQMQQAALKTRLKEEHCQTERLQHQLEAAHVNARWLAGEVAEKDVVIASLEQRVHDLSADLGNLDKQFRAKDAVAADAESRIQALEEEIRAEEMRADRISSLTADRDALAQRLQVAGNLFHKFQTTVEAEHANYRSKGLAALLRRRKLEAQRRSVSLWLACVAFRAKIRDCEWHARRADHSLARRGAWWGERRANRQAASIMLVWRWRQRQGERLRAKFRKTMHRNVRRVFWALKGAIRQRECVTHIVSIWLHRKTRAGLHMVWDLWQEIAQEGTQRKAQQNREAAQQCVRHSLSLWRQWATQAAAHHRLLSRIFLLRGEQIKRGASSAIVKTWQAAARGQCRKRVLVDRAVARMRSRALAHAMRLLCHAGRQACRSREVGRRATALVARGRGVPIDTVFVAWFAHVRRAWRIARLSSAVAIMSGRELSRSFREWRAVVENVRMEEQADAWKRRVMASVMMRKMMRSLHACFMMWLELSAESARERARARARETRLAAGILRIVSQTKRGKLGRAAAAWRQKCSGARRACFRMEAISLKQRRAAACSTFDVLAYLAAQGRRRRRLMTHVLNILLRAWLCVMVRRWQVRAHTGGFQRQTQIILSLSARERGQTAAAFSRWISYSESVPWHQSRWGGLADRMTKASRFQDIVWELNALVEESSRSRMLVEEESERAPQSLCCSPEPSLPGPAPMYETTAAPHLPGADQVALEVDEAPMRAEEEDCAAAAEVAAAGEFVLSELHDVFDVLVLDGPDVENGIFSCSQSPAPRSARNAWPQDASEVSKHSESGHCSECRIPLAAIQVLSEAEAIYKQVALARAAPSRGYGCEDKDAVARLLGTAGIDAETSCVSLSSVLHTTSTYQGSTRNRGVEQVDALSLRSERSGLGAGGHYLARGRGLDGRAEGGELSDGDTKTASSVGVPSASVLEQLQRLSQLRARLGRSGGVLGGGLR